MNDTREILQSAVDAVTTLFLAGDDDVRRAIETGVLEHVLEQAPMRPLFSHWAHDERLQDAWRQALAYGKAHPNFMKSHPATFHESMFDEPLRSPVCGRRLRVESCRCVGAQV